jgi:hypothetical protein
MEPNPGENRLRLVAVIAALLTAGAPFLLISGAATATPQFGAATGQPCAACHVRPDGGPDLTEFGKKFEANGNKLPKP